MLKYRSRECKHRSSACMGACYRSRLNGHRFSYPGWCISVSAYKDSVYKGSVIVVMCGCAFYVFFFGRIVLINLKVARSCMWVVLATGTPYINLLFYYLIVHQIFLLFIKKSYCSFLHNKSDYRSGIVRWICQYTLDSSSLLSIPFTFIRIYCVCFERLYNPLTYGSQWLLIL